MQQQLVTLTLEWEICLVSNKCSIPEKKIVQENTLESHIWRDFAINRLFCTLILFVINFALDWLLYTTAV